MTVEEAVDGDAQLAALLEYLRRNRGFDFTGYKRTSLRRRIAKRMEEVGSTSYAEYQDHLEVDPDEYAALFDTILINVTGFFRDTAAWKALGEALSRVLEGKREDEPIRVWCAGCASGEEAFTVAMVLAELLGIPAFRERVKIYGTDVDETVLAQARQASFDARRLADVPDDLVERYFEPNGGRRTFRADLRRSVIFGRNDLVSDAPISRVDLLLCRNTLMYFTAEAQSDIVRRFHFALRDDGILFLGKSEMLVTRSGLFAPLDLKRRLFVKVSRATPGRTRLQFATSANDGDGSDEGDAAVRDRAFDLAPDAIVGVGPSGTVAAVNARARALFGLSAADVGRPLQDLELSYRPVELRAAIQRAQKEREGISLGRVEWRTSPDELRRLDVAVVPLMRHGGTLGAAIVFADVTEHARLEADLERSRRDLETAYEELQSTVEELETTNEELQSTNEELETTNEELQSTNEELETMNEELQSSNEELETINDELRLRTNELDDVNAFLETILSSMGFAVTVLDGEQRIQVWSRLAEDLWGLRADEVDGEHMMSLDIGLPVDELRKPLKTSLGGDEGVTLEVDAVNRRGKAIRCEISCLPLRADDGAVSGVVVLMKERASG